MRTPGSGKLARGRSAAFYKHRGQLHIAHACYLGLDFGTSGARACVIDGVVLHSSHDCACTSPKAANSAVAKHSRTEPRQRDAASITSVPFIAVTDIAEYILGFGALLCATKTALTLGNRVCRAMWHLLSELSPEVLSDVRRVAIDGTSATAVLVDAASGKPLADAKLYNEAQPADAVARASALVSDGSPAAAATSALSKVEAWANVISEARAAGLQPVLLHHADWLASLLSGERCTTDWNNALKLGFDCEQLRFPLTFEQQPWYSALPARVLMPGADRVGDAVTSLGSTLAIKLLSERPVKDHDAGIYSHRLGVGWLVGGASNSGGAVLRQHFSDEELAVLTPRMDASRPTNLGYYPLPATGERFPINDPDKAPQMQPRPHDAAVFLQGLLEGMADIERRAFAAIVSKGGTPVQRVYTAGGGAKNPVWTELRQKALGVPVILSPNGDASYGAALLARGLRPGAVERLQP